jgi:hypothetical protein
MRKKLTFGKVSKTGAAGYGKRGASGEGMGLTFGKVSKTEKLTFGKVSKTEKLTFGKVSKTGAAGYGKRGATGEGILTMYRVLIIIFIALIILVISNVFYSHYIDVRDTEAKVMARNVIGCVLSDFDFMNFNGELLKHCGYKKGTERFFVRLTFVDENGKEIRVISHGDSGAMWVREIFKEDKMTENIKQYKPGFFDYTYPYYYAREERDIKVRVEVLVNEGA